MIGPRRRSEREEKTSPKRTSVSLRWPVSGDHLHFFVYTTLIPLLTILSADVELPDAAPALAPGVIAAGLPHAPRPLPMIPPPAREVAHVGRPHWPFAPNAAIEYARLIAVSLRIRPAFPLACPGASFPSTSFRLLTQLPLIIPTGSRLRWSSRAARTACGHDARREATLACSLR